MPVGGWHATAAATASPSSGGGERGTGPRRARFFLYVVMYIRTTATTATATANHFFYIVGVARGAEVEERSTEAEEVGAGNRAVKEVGFLKN